MKTRIKEIREEKGMSQKELARRLKISPSTLSQIERPDNNTQFKTIERIAEALDCHPSDLIVFEPTVEIDTRTIFNGDEFTPEWQEFSERVRNLDSIKDPTQLASSWKDIIRDLKKTDDQKYIEALSVPALKLNNRGRKLLLDQAELYTTFEMFTSINGNETEKEE